VEKLPVVDTAPVALDWINGRRTPDADQSLKAGIVGLNLGTKAPEIFKAIVESICFGSRKIVERFRDEGVEIKSVVGIGGVAKKSPFVMQCLANVLNMPIRIAVSEQAPALGGAMYAATAAGLYKNVSLAAIAMSNGFEKTYFPEADKVAVYDRLYKSYSALGEFVESTKRTH
jgi:L-ribulokinase